MNEEARCCGQVPTYTGVSRRVEGGPQYVHICNVCGAKVGLDHIIVPQERPADTTPPIRSPGWTYSYVTGAVYDEQGNFAGTMFIEDNAVRQTIMAAPKMRDFLEFYREVKDAGDFGMGDLLRRHPEFQSYKDVEVYLDMWLHELMNDLGIRPREWGKEGV